MIRQGLRLQLDICDSAIGFPNSKRRVEWTRGSCGVGQVELAIGPLSETSDFDCGYECVGFLATKDGLGISPGARERA